MRQKRPGSAALFSVPSMIVRLSLVALGEMISARSPTSWYTTSASREVPGPMIATAPRSSIA